MYLGKILKIIILSWTYLTFPQKAHAYIDPGTGSYILQMILAGLLGATFAIKIFWKRIKNFFINLFLKPNEDKKNIK
jgi:hypothetical protein